MEQTNIGSTEDVEKRRRRNVCYSILVELQIYNLCRDTLHKVPYVYMDMYGHAWLSVTEEGISVLYV